MTTPIHLFCDNCGASFTDRWRCSCGQPLRFSESPVPKHSIPDPASFDARTGLWSFDEFLPVGDDPSDRVTLGEGMTPLVDVAEADAEFKLEYVFPTGSFKDRGATMIVTRANELGVDRIIDDSSGNAGHAIATYAARAGIDTEIYVPAGVKAAKLRAIEHAGAKPVRIEGNRQDVTDACVSALEEGDAWYASHAWRPSFYAGTSTCAFEVALQRDWESPDVIVTPLGQGTLFLGLYRGFRALHSAGWIDELPRLLGVQAAGKAPIVEMLHGSEAATAETVNDIADGIQISKPVQQRYIRTAIDETGGNVIALDKADTEQALNWLHRAGFFTEPTSAVAFGGFRAYRERGIIGPDDDVIVALTGSGNKAA